MSIFFALVVTVLSEKNSVGNYSTGHMGDICDNCM